MNKRFLLVTVSISMLSLIQSGCSSDPIVYQEPIGKPAYNKQSPRVSEVEGGYVQTRGGQVGIVSKKVHIVTLDPKPKVVMPKEPIIDFDEKPERLKKGVLSSTKKSAAAKIAVISNNDSEDAYKAWVDYCDGKELTMEQQELIDNSDMPPELEGTCDRIEK